MIGMSSKQFAAQGLFWRLPCRVRQRVFRLRRPALAAYYDRMLHDQAGAYSLVPSMEPSSACRFLRRACEPHPDGSEAGEEKALGGVAITSEWIFFAFSARWRRARWCFLGSVCITARRRGRRANA